MGVLMIKCPATGRAISTGIRVQPESFNCTPVFFSQTFCPACRTEHEWFAPQAWVGEEHPQERSGMEFKQGQGSRLPS